MHILKKLRVQPGAKIALARCSTTATPGCRDKAEAAASLEAMLAELRELQYALYAENRRALLIILQGMDASGKDGVARHVLTGLNPQGCRVTSFKAPTPIELQHDFLWRIHQAAPPAGEIGVFNRSHYEDVLVVRVHGLVPPTV
jgi:polyphosphate kinase 2 (PPK2 family)